MIAVGLVSARLLAFPQTIGIILGTNIGTTVTLQFFTFDLSKDYYSSFGYRTGFLFSFEVSNKKQRLYFHGDWD